MILDYRVLRHQMVATQLIPRGITDERVLDAFRKVPREKFVPENVRSSAYDDCALPIGHGQTISQPYMVAIMTELLGLKGKEKVLEIGTGSGYQAAILSELCARVYSIERVSELAAKAKKTLNELGYANVEVIVADGTKGFSGDSLYDRIIVTAAAEKIPSPLLDQLVDGGKLVMPVGDRYFQTLTIVSREKDKIITEQSIGCVFVPLVGGN